MDDLQQRIQRLEDIEAIRLLKAGYFHACDRKDVDSIRQCFAAGPVLIDYGAIGRFTRREDFIAVYVEKACQPQIVDMHHGHNAQINWISPGSATAVWDLFFYQIDTATTLLTQLGGHYEDRYSQHEGRWQISETRFQITSSQVISVADGQFRMLFSGATPP